MDWESNLDAIIKCTDDNLRQQFESHQIPSINIAQSFRSVPSFRPPVRSVPMECERPPSPVTTPPPPMMREPPFEMPIPPSHFQYSQPQTYNIANMMEQIRFSIKLEVDARAAIAERQLSAMMALTKNNSDELDRLRMEYGTVDREVRTLDQTQQKLRQDMTTQKDIMYHVQSMCGKDESWRMQADNQLLELRQLVAALREQCNSIQVTMQEKLSRPELLVHFNACVEPLKAQLNAGVQHQAQIVGELSRTGATNAYIVESLQKRTNELQSELQSVKLDMGAFNKRQNFVETINPAQDPVPQKTSNQVHDAEAIEATMETWWQKENDKQSALWTENQSKQELKAMMVIENATQRIQNEVDYRLKRLQDEIEMKPNLTQLKCQIHETMDSWTAKHTQSLHQIQLNQQSIENERTERKKQVDAVQDQLMQLKYNSMENLHKGLHEIRVEFQGAQASLVKEYQAIYTNTMTTQVAGILKKEMDPLQLTVQKLQHDDKLYEQNILRLEKELESVVKQQKTTKNDVIEIEGKTAHVSNSLEGCSKEMTQINNLVRELSSELKGCSKKNEAIRMEINTIETKTKQMEQNSTVFQNEIKNELKQYMSLKEYHEMEKKQTKTIPSPYSYWPPHMYMMPPTGHFGHGTYPMQYSLPSQPPYDIGRQDHTTIQSSLPVYAQQPTDIATTKPNTTASDEMADTVTTGTKRNQDSITPPLESKKQEQPRIASTLSHSQPGVGMRPPPENSNISMPPKTIATIGEKSLKEVLSATNVEKQEQKVSTQSHVVPPPSSNSTELNLPKTTPKEVPPNLQTAATTSSPASTMKQNAVSPQQTTISHTTMNAPSNISTTSKPPVITKTISTPSPIITSSTPQTPSAPPPSKPSTDPPTPASIQLTPNLASSEQNETASVQGKTIIKAEDSGPQKKSSSDIPPSPSSRQPPVTPSSQPFQRQTLMPSVPTTPKSHDSSPISDAQRPIKSATLLDDPTMKGALAEAELAKARVENRMKMERERRHTLGAPPSSVDSAPSPRHSVTESRVHEKCLKCSQDIPFGTKVEHERNQCPMRMITCSVCTQPIVAKDMTSHPCEKPLVKCKHCLVEVGDIVEHELKCEQALKQCPHCLRRQKMAELQDHINNCDCRLVQCPNACGGKFLQRGLEKHVLTKCPKRPQPASSTIPPPPAPPATPGQVPSVQKPEKKQPPVEEKMECKYCDEKFLSSAIEEHETSCDWKPKRCQFCNMVIIARDLARHEGNCKQSNRQCSHCLQSFPSPAFASHLPKCPKRPIKCIRCGNLYPADIIVAHSTSCKPSEVKNIAPPPPSTPPPAHLFPANSPKRKSESDMRRYLDTTPNPDTSDRTSRRNFALSQLTASQEPPREESDKEEDEDEMDDMTLAQVVSEWNVDNVCLWLKEDVGVPEVVDRFEALRIDGRMLLDIDERSLVNDLGIKSKSNRDRILAAIEAIKTSDEYSDEEEEEEEENVEPSMHSTVLTRRLSMGSSPQTQANLLNRINSALNSGGTLRKGS